MNTDEQNVELGIFVDTGIRTVPIEWRGNTYNFKVRGIPWVEKQRLMTKYMNAGGNKNKISVQADMGGYHQELLLRMLVDTDGLFAVNKMTIMKLSDSFGEYLVEQIIDKEEDSLTEEDAKN